MDRSNNDADIRQCQSDERFAGRSVSDSSLFESSEVDTLTLAMRQLMQLPGQPAEVPQQI